MTIKVWFVREGPDPTSGSTAYELPLKSCVEVLGLERRHWIFGADDTPRFGDQSTHLAGIADYRHIVCEINEEEAKAAGWEAGFYRADLSPAEAVDRLGPTREPWDR